VLNVTTTEIHLPRRIVDEVNRHGGKSSASKRSCARRAESQRAWCVGMHGAATRRSSSTKLTNWREVSRTYFLRFWIIIDSTLIFAYFLTSQAPGPAMGDGVDAPRRHPSAKVEVLIIHLKGDVHGTRYYNRA
jgi:hypothetical protein